MPIDLRHQCARWAVNVASGGQLIPDIQKKFQKINGFKGKNVSELMGIAQKTFDNKVKKIRKLAEVLVMQKSQGVNTRDI